MPCSVGEGARVRDGLFANLASAPPLVFGCEQLGGYNWGDVDIGEMRDALSYALDCGIVAFDTADCYGPYLSEQRLGVALAGVRDRVIIATKFGVRLDNQGRRRNDSSPAWCRSAIEGSIRRLGVERIDLYQMHCHDGHTPLEDTVGALEDLRSRGLIRGWGLCNVAPATVPPTAWGGCESLQAELSLLAATQEHAAMQACERGVQFLAYGVLGQGLLSGSYDAGSRFSAGDRRTQAHYRNFHGARLRAALKLVDELKGCAVDLGCSASTLAIAWVRSLHLRVWPIVGIKRRSHVEDALRAVRLTVPQYVRTRLRAAATAFEEA